jgi:hypothetical protein
LLSLGPDVAAAASKLGEAAARFEMIRAARRVIFAFVQPQTAPHLCTVAEGTANGMAWTSENLRGPAEPTLWAGSPGGELHYCVAGKIRLRVYTAAQLDAAGFEPPGIVWAQQPVRL